MSRRGDRAECRRCARLPAPSSASPFADAVADAALVRVPPAETKRRAFALGRSSGARVSPLTARALAQKAREEGDALDPSDESDEDWRSARSAQTTRSGSVTATGRDASETDDAFPCETENDFGEPDLRYFSRAADEAFSSFSSRRDASARGAPSLARAQPGAIVSPALVSSGRGDACEQTVRGTRGRGAKNENETEAAFAALERATADFEDDALEENDTNATRTKQNGTKEKKNGSWRFPLGGSRLAKIGEGARMVSAVRLALRKAGGVLDLTAFKGTPIKWHAPHSALLAHARGESTLKRRRRVGETARATRLQFVGTPDDEDEENGGGVDVFEPENLARFDEDSGVLEASDDWLARRPPRAARLFTSLNWAFGNLHGCDGIGPTQLALQAEVREPTEVPSPKVIRGAPRSECLNNKQKRMLAVISAVLADCEPPALFRKPFNPVLGETARHTIRFNDGASVTSVLEQVSHHPPITAFHSEHRFGDGGRDATETTIGGFAAFGHFRPRPSLRGFPFAGKVHIDIEGTRTFRVVVNDGCDSHKHGAGSSRGGEGGRVNDVFFEDYVVNYVGFEWLFFPAPRARTRAGETHVVRCARTGLVADIEHTGGGSGSEVRGTVYEEPPHGVTRFDAVDVDGVLLQNSDGSDQKLVRSARSLKKTRAKDKEKKNTSTGTPLFAIRGAVDARVVATCLNTNETFVLYDADVAALREAQSVVRDVAFDLDANVDPRGSFSVWRSVTRLMREKKWDDARRAKSRVEAAERIKRAARDFVFEPRFFERDEVRDTWVLHADAEQEEGEPRRAPSGRRGGRREGDAAIDDA